MGRTLDLGRNADLDSRWCGPAPALLVAAAAALPFAAGALLYEPTRRTSAGRRSCARSAPRPASRARCAAAPARSRSPRTATRGFLDYNAVAVLVLAAAVVLGLVAALAPRGPAGWARDALSRLAAAPVTRCSSLALVAWAWTLTHRATITS